MTLERWYLKFPPGDVDVIEILTEEEYDEEPLVGDCYYSPVIVGEGEAFETIEELEDWIDLENYRQGLW